MKKKTLLTTIIAGFACCIIAFSACSSSDDSIGAPGIEEQEQGGNKVLLDVADEVWVMDKNNNLSKVADNSCKGVVLKLSNGKSFMIEKNEYKNSSYKAVTENIQNPSMEMVNSRYFFVATEKYDTIYDTNYSIGDTIFGCFPDKDGNVLNNFDVLPSDITLWTNGALSHWNGKESTAMMMKSWNPSNYMYYDYYFAVEKLFLEFNKTPKDNLGFDDWYIPTAAQLAAISLFEDDVNKALAAIGGTPLTMTNIDNIRKLCAYISSTETLALNIPGYKIYQQWFISFGIRHVGAIPKNSLFSVRFVRDL